MRIRGLSPQQVMQLGFARSKPTEGVQHAFICIADHFEPLWQRPSEKIAAERVVTWIREYPRMADGVADSLGRPPQQTFFCPQDEYEPQHMDGVVELCDKGFGEVEVHLHHFDDTAEGLREKLLSFTELLHDRHGRFRRDKAGRLAFAFVHGNWALNNSRPDGKCCGVNNETEILLQTGCYCDMTMPSAPDAAQTSTMNSIYYAFQGSGAKSHDCGKPSRVGQLAPADGLLMIQGPLALDWSSRKYWVLPKLENGDLTGERPPTLHRFALWMHAGVQVQGRENWHFIKLHTHGAQEKNSAMFFGGAMREFHLALERRARDSELRYHYVTAREMVTLVRQAESGLIEPAFDSYGIPVETNQAVRETGTSIRTERTSSFGTVS